MSDEKVPLSSQGADFEKLFNILNQARSTNCLGDEDEDEDDEESDISSYSGSDSSEFLFSEESEYESGKKVEQIMTTLQLLSKSQNRLTDAFIRLLNV
jgi:hypothetical protein